MSWRVRAASWVSRNGYGLLGQRGYYYNYAVFLEIRPQVLAFRERDSFILSFQLCDEGYFGLLSLVNILEVYRMNLSVDLAWLINLNNFSTFSILTFLALSCQQYLTTTAILIDWQYSYNCLNTHWNSNAAYHNVYL